MDQVQNVATNVRGQVGEVLATKGTTILGILLLVGLACFVVAYLLYKVITYVVVKTSVHTVPGTQVPLAANKYSKLDGSGIPNAGNGKRLSMSFWVYVSDIDKYAGTPRHIFHRGTDKVTVDSGPVVMLDAETNKLHVILDMNLTNAYKLVPTNGASEGAMKIAEKMPTSASPSAIDGATGTIKSTPPLSPDDVRFLAAAQGITLDYIPLQRWVHVVIVANENAGGGTLTAYIDGELVKSVSHTDLQAPFPSDPSKKVATSITNLALDHRGDIWVGGDSTSAVGPGFAGLVSNIKFFNYDLNVKDVYTVYQEGPINNLLAKLGLPAYGVRSPVYRLS